MDLQQVAVDAYLNRNNGVSEAIIFYGAALSFSGIADIGGLMGGGIENCRETDSLGAISEAIAAFRFLGLPAVAQLIDRAHAEYARMRPGGASYAMSEEDEQLWDELDEQWFALNVTGQLDQIGERLTCDL